jgi:hypothetical protein
MTAILDALGIVAVPGEGALAEAHADIVAMLPPLPDIEGMPASEWACGDAGKVWIAGVPSELDQCTSADMLSLWMDDAEPRLMAFSQYTPRQIAKVRRMLRAAMDRLLLD